MRAGDSAHSPPPSRQRDGGSQPNEAAAGASAVAAARDLLGGHPVFDQADDRRKDRTGNSAAGELANERADID